MYELETTAVLKTHRSTSRKDGDSSIPSASFKMVATVGIDEVIALMVTGDEQKKIKDLFWNSNGDPRISSPMALSFKRDLEMNLKIHDSFMDDLHDEEKGNLILENTEAVLVKHEAKIQEAHQVELTLNFFMPVNSVQAGSLSIRIGKDVYIILTDKQAQIPAAA